MAHRLSEFFVLFLVIIIVIITIGLYCLGGNVSRIHKIAVAPTPDSAGQFENTNRMVLAITIAEQMTMAMSHVYDLARFAADWDAMVVLPFVTTTYLTGIPSLNKTLPLSLLYNIEMLQKVNEKYDILPFIQFEYFMKYSDRKSIYYFYITDADKGVRRAYGPTVEKCDKPFLEDFNSTINLLNQEALRRKFPGFELSNSHCCKVHSSRHSTQPETLIKGCGMRGVKSFTIVFNRWKGVFTRRMKGSYRLFAPHYRNINKVPRYSELPYSDYVEEMTRVFVKYLTNDQSFIGVHIRAEKLWLRHRNNPQYPDDKCVQDCIKLAHQTAKQEHSNIKNVLYFGDRFVTKKYGHLLTGISLSHFNSSRFNAIESDALIAQIEQNTLSYAEELVMCGGGSFETSIGLRFNKRKPKGSIRTVCS